MEVVSTPTAFRQSRYRWNPAANHGKGAYIGADGRFVSVQEVRRSLDKTLDNIKEENQRLAQRLRDGTITLERFQDQMADQIKSVHLISAAMERGGWAQLTQSDYGRVGRLLYNPSAGESVADWGEYQFLRRMGKQIASGEQPLDGTLDRRLDLYGEAGRHTYHEFERRKMQARGFDQERSLLHAQDSCERVGETPGCVGEAGKRWQPIGEMAPIGERVCTRNCRCTVAYRNSLTGEEVGR